MFICSSWPCRMDPYYVCRYRYTYIYFNIICIVENMVQNGDLITRYYEFIRNMCRVPPKSCVWWSMKKDWWMSHLETWKYIFNITTRLLLPSGNQTWPLVIYPWYPHVRTLNPQFLGITPHSLGCSHNFPYWVDVPITPRPGGAGVWDLRLLSSPKNVFHLQQIGISSSNLVWPWIFRQVWSSLMLSRPKWMRFVAMFNHV